MYPSCASGLQLHVLGVIEYLFAQRLVLLIPLAISLRLPADLFVPCLFAFICSIFLACLLISSGAVLLVTFYLAWWLACWPLPPQICLRSSLTRFSRESWRDTRHSFVSFDVTCYVPESHFISMAAIRNFKWDSWAAWQFRWSPSCALAFGCCGGATPVGLPFGSSSLIFISADVVSSIGLLYSFTDLSLCTCIVSLSLYPSLWPSPFCHLQHYFTSFCY